MALPSSARHLVLFGFAALGMMPFSAARAASSSMPTECFDAAGCYRLVAGSGDSRPTPDRGREEVDFLPSIRVDYDQNHEHREPAVAWGPAGELYAVYVARYSHYNPERVLISRSLDGGLTWQEPVQINDTSPNAVMMPSMAVGEDGAVYAVWGEMKFAPYNNEIRFARSNDGGATWTPSAHVHPEAPGEDYYRPDLCMAGDRLLVAYFQAVAYPNGEPHIVSSDDHGLTWTPPVPILSNACPYDGAPPRLAYDPQSGWLGAVVATGSELILFTRSSDGGASWEMPVTVNDHPASSAGDPDLVSTAGRFHVVFADTRNGAHNTDIFHTSSPDGVVFTPSVQVNDAFPGNQYEAHLHAGADGRLHAAWIWNEPFQSDVDLYYSRSDDAGETWLAESPRVNDVPHTVEPYVTWTCDLLGDSAGEAYVFWNDGRSSGYYDNLYFTRSESHSASVTFPNGHPNAPWEAHGDAHGDAHADPRGDDFRDPASDPSPGREPGQVEGGSLRVWIGPCGSCLLQLHLPESSPHSRLSLHDLNGRELCRGSLGPLPSGTSERSWKLPSGTSLGSGVRFLRLETSKGATLARWLTVR